MDFFNSVDNASCQNNSVNGRAICDRVRPSKIIRMLERTAGALFFMIYVIRLSYCLKGEYIKA